MRDLALTTDRELKLDIDGELGFVDQHAETMQAVETTVRTMPGEWWLDEDFGMLDPDTFFPEDKDFQPARGSSRVRRSITELSGVYRIANQSVALSEDRAFVDIAFDCYSIYSPIPTRIRETLGL